MLFRSGDMVVDTGYPVIIVVVMVVAGEMQTDVSIALMLIEEICSCFIEKQRKQGRRSKKNFLVKILKRANSCW